MNPSEENPEELIIVARAVRTRGLKGELVAEVLTDFPERFEKVSAMFGVAPTGERKPLNLESHWFQNGRLIIKFSGYDSVDAAQSLVGYELGIREAERVQLPSNQYYDWELQGCAVETKQGMVVGEVRDVMRTGGVELLVVESDTGSQHLIPLAEAIVVKVDLAEKKVVIDPPEGLLDL